MTAPHPPERLRQTSEKIRKILKKHAVQLTLGGEPTFVPIHPSGPEWSVSAVGPTKLTFAWQLAQKFLDGPMKGGAAFLSLGKSYPDEMNPRWVIRILSNRDGTPFHRCCLLKPRKAKPADLVRLRNGLSHAMHIPLVWTRFTDCPHPGTEAFACLLDHDGTSWKSCPWKIPHSLAVLNASAGPPGLRLPLETIPERAAHRTLTVDLHEGSLRIFLPPLLQQPFLQLYHAVQAILPSYPQIEFQGYIPFDEQSQWTTLGIATDPGVLEINLPACKSWEEYDRWMHELYRLTKACGLRAWKKFPREHPVGTGGGSHFLLGGPSLESNPFFTRPAWLASLLRYWQHHPSLAYVFTGCYVGSFSQAPRPDESTRDLYDLEMAYRFLETLPSGGDHRHIISETLRHIHTDVAGNSHRSEISFDKFWNTSWPGGALGLIEFRAIESPPDAIRASAIALLWIAIAALLLDKPLKSPLREFGPSLHDRFFLPSFLWNDLREILRDLRNQSLPLPEKAFHNIWEWNFPLLLQVRRNNTFLEIRQAHESWPLLCETPTEGGSTSRFVDTSIRRLEFRANTAFVRRFRLFVNRRSLLLFEAEEGFHIAGLRYRHTQLYPSLHPGVPPQLPLQITLQSTGPSGRCESYQLRSGQLHFHPTPSPSTPGSDPPCKTGKRGDITYDLRIATI